jgi:uncharacterized protein YwqG
MENELETITKQLEQFKRSTWKPVIRDEDGDLLSSKFSGTPWLSENESWPRCAICNSKLELFVQLNLSSIPRELDFHMDNALLQFFFCSNFNSSTCIGWEPFSKSHLARIIIPDGKPNLTPDYPDESFPAKTIVSWTELDDYPQLHEVDIPYPSNNEVYKHLNTLTARPGDKLAGWPYWVQGVEYPNCPTCGKKMQFIFQIDSEDNLPYTFGDVGCGHITQCPEHNDVLAFGWACC